MNTHTSISENEGRFPLAQEVIIIIIIIIIIILFNIMNK